MSLSEVSNLSDAIAQGRRLRGPECPVNAIWEGLDENGKADLATNLRDLTVSAKAIQRGLRAWTGIHISHPSVLLHRRGDCKCAKYKLGMYAPGGPMAVDHE